MEEEWMRDRALLRDLLTKDPQTPPQELARATGRSVSWVKKWRKRLREGDPHDQERLCSRSRAHHAPYFRWDLRVETCIVEMRLSPPEHLGRTPGPRALLYYLPRDPALQAAGVRLPRSSRTVWKLLRKTGCILPKPQRNLWPTEPREPLEEIQMDFKDVSSVSAEQSSQGKRQHVIEVCNFVDAGTSLALFAQAREDFHEQTAMEAVISFLQTYGRPHQITFDRDPRWVGSVSGRDFPSPLRRLLLCLGITPFVCPPHRPDKNAYVERYHRTYGQECLQLHRPSTRKAGTRGNRGVSPALQRRTSSPGANLWQCPASCGLSDVASLTSSPRAGGPGCLADSTESEAVSAPCGSRWVCRSRSGDLLHRSSDGRTYSPVPSASREPPICRLASGPGRQATSYQRVGRAGDGPLRLSEVYPTRGVGCPAAFFCP
jgi:transposase InsO family protein